MPDMYASSRSFGVVFFFQAEDGIRDLIVTGVQTCALPIYLARRQKIEENMRAFPLIKDVDQHTTAPYSDIRAALFKEFAPRDKKGRVKKLRQIGRASCRERV